MLLFVFTNYILTLTPDPDSEMVPERMRAVELPIELELVD